MDRLSLLEEENLLPLGTKKQLGLREENGEKKENLWKRILSVILIIILGLIVITRQNVLQSVRFIQGAGDSWEDDLFVPPNDRSIGSRLPLIVNEMDNVPPIALNSTLGFEKIFAISLKSRPDKKGLMTILAGMTDMKLDFFEGRTPDSLGRGLQAAAKDERTGLGTTGCFWSHASVLQKVIEEDITSALITEDDLDWSMNIKEQLGLLERPLSLLIDEIQPKRNPRIVSKSDPFHSADWDILWLGTCDEDNWATNRPTEWANSSYVPFVAYPDEFIEDPNVKTMPFMKKMMREYNLTKDEEASASGQGIRIVQPSKSTMCMTAYAVSNVGAKKILEGLLTAPWRPVDIIVRDLIKNSKLRAYSALPPLFSQWRHADGSKDSDIKDAGGFASDHKADVEGGHSLHIINGVRKQLQTYNFRFQPPRFP